MILKVSDLSEPKPPPDEWFASYFAPDEDMTLGDRLLKHVVYLGIPRGQHSLSFDWMGSGFVISVPRTAYPAGVTRDIDHTYLVTAAHVVEGIEADAGDNYRVYVPTATGDWRGYRLRKRPGWVFADSLFDLAVIELDWQPEFDIIPTLYEQLFRDDMYDRERLGAGSDVLIPARLGSTNEENEPHLKFGTLSRRKAGQYRVRAVEGSRATILREAYIVEVRSFQGWSGSPTFLWRSPTPHHRGLIPGFMGIYGDEVSRASGAMYLLGVMMGIWYISERDMNKMQLPIAPVRKKTVNYGVALVTPAYALRDLLDSSQMVRRREQRELHMEASGPTAQPT